MSQKSGELDQGLVDYLAQFITPHKRTALERVLSQQTRFFTVVLADIFKPHNVSAVLRTCDCFGIKDIHLIERIDTYKINPFVALGASQGVDLHKYFSQAGLLWTSGLMHCVKKDIKSRGRVQWQIHNSYTNCLSFQIKK